jgi:hypothetical protein
LQLITAHVPVVHVGVAFGVEHGLPQLPQLLSVVVLVSQPLPSEPSQLPKPLEHEDSSQDRLAHDEIALG